jgi:thiamine pyrophosphokinase
MNIKKRAVIIGGGDIGDYAYIKSLVTPTDYIVCADSGYDHALAMGLAVDLAVGDFDSVRNMPPEGIRITFPSKKDKTDTEIALDAVRGKGYGEFLFLGCLGDRFDHSLGNVLLLVSCLKQNERACIVNERNAVYITDSSIEMDIKKGQVVSLLPLADCEGVVTHNLEYPLRGDKLPLGTGRGISNVAVGDGAGVSISKGLLMVTVVS